MINKNTIELFCGTKSFSKVAEKFGFNIFTTDIDKNFKPDDCVDIFDFKPPNKIFHLLWASPPCESFSVASIGKHWNKNHTPKTEQAVYGLKMLNKTIKIILDIEPTYWFIENPRGKMRKVIDDIILKNLGNFYKRETVCYCRYGDTRMKPTDIWTNCFKWTPKNKMCFNGCSDHESAPRGSKTGTQGLDNYKDRSRIPEKLFFDIFEHFIIS